MRNLWIRKMVWIAACTVLVGCGDTVPLEISSNAESPENESETPDEENDEDIEAQEGQYSSLFSDPQSDQIFVAYSTESDLRLFRFDEDWSEIELPKSLQDKSDVQISGVVATDFDLLLSTDNHGVFQRESGNDQWQSFAPEWLANDHRITRIRKVHGQVYAFNEVLPDAPEGVELWERDGLDWRYVRSDMFMIIDYIPRQAMYLRATYYGTVEISHDDGESWEVVPDVFSGVAPKLFEWGDDVAVATTGGVWITRDDGHNWEFLSSQRGRTGALMGDELVVAEITGFIGAVDLNDGTTRELPQVPTATTLLQLDLAVSGQSIFASTGDSELLKLADDGESWERVDPAQF